MKVYKDSEVRTKKIIRKRLDYVVCDNCKKEIRRTRPEYTCDFPEYIYIHTWHNDWGNDSVDSDEYYTFCKDCAKKFITDYIDKSRGTEELELSRKVVSPYEYEDEEYVED